MVVFQKGILAKNRKSFFILFYSYKFLDKPSFEIAPGVQNPTFKNVLLLQLVELNVCNWHLNPAKSFTFRSLNSIFHLDQFKMDITVALFVAILQTIWRQRLRIMIISLAFKHSNSYETFSTSGCISYLKM